MWMWDNRTSIILLPFIQCWSMWFICVCQQHLRNRTAEQSRNSDWCEIGLALSILDFFVCWLFSKLAFSKISFWNTKSTSFIQFGHRSGLVWSGSIHTWSGVLYHVEWVKSYHRIAQDVYYIPFSDIILILKFFWSLVQKKNAGMFAITLRFLTLRHHVFPSLVLCFKFTLRSVAAKTGYRR